MPSRHNTDPRRLALRCEHGERRDQHDSRVVAVRHHRGRQGLSGDAGLDDRGIARRRRRLRSQLAKRVQDLITAEEGGSAASLDTTSSVTTLNSASWWRPYDVVLATSVATSLAFVLKRAAQSILVMLAIALIA